MWDHLKEKWVTEEVQGHTSYCNRDKIGTLITVNIFMYVLYCTVCCHTAHINIKY